MENTFRPPYKLQYSFPGFCNIATNNYYRSQRSCGKIIFLHLSVILFTVLGGMSASGRGGSATHTHTHTHTHLGRHPSGQTPPWADNPQADTPCPVHAGIHTPSACWDTHPLHSACWDTVNKRAVRIPLECILVLLTFASVAAEHLLS